jgi:SAM-dependent methyltransferase
MGGFKDHFSGHATLYRQSRPSYPLALYQWLAEQAPSRHCAWDCATGNGQAALTLAHHFAQVIGTDASPEQIAQAEAAERVSYRVASAEHSDLTAHSVDLLCVAQAAHWFDLPAFYEEVRRVARRGAILALWSYGLTCITPAVDAVVDGYYRDTVGPWWPPERAHVEAGYRDLPFPFDELQAPDFSMQADWTLQQLLAYLASWSATQRCAADTGTDPIPALARELAPAWGEVERRAVSWPLSLRVGRLP